MIKSLGITAAVTLASMALPALAQDANETPEPNPFLEAVSESIIDIERADGGGLTGEGWDRLITEADAAHFFLIGETHSTADIALVASALHREIAPFGYDHLVVEMGPWSTRFAEGLIRESDTALADHIAAPGNAFDLPFLSAKEEIDFLVQAVKLSRHDTAVLWGVDQEFIAAGQILAEVLSGSATTDAQRKAAEAFTAGAASSFMHLGAAPQAEIDALVAAFADGPDDPRALSEAIALSHRVYGPFVRGTGPIYPANLERENYMKANFLQHFRKAEDRLGTPPKALFKFGGFHMEQGLSGTNVPSFGNFVMEWGRSRNLKSVHIMIDCLSGEAWAIQQNEPRPCKPYALEEGSLIMEALRGRDAALIDLRSLRPKLRSSTEIDAKTRDLILSFDYYLALRDVKAGTPAAHLTFPPQ